MSFASRKLFSIFREKGAYCYYCGKEADTIDHFIPRRKGGTDENKNLIPCCGRCNIRKSARTLEHFRELAMRKENNMPKFEPEHIEFLRRYGFTLPIIEHKFWFEKQGIKI